VTAAGVVVMGVMAVVTGGVMFRVHRVLPIEIETAAV
jgi:hypothetical protein